MRNNAVLSVIALGLVVSNVVLAVRVIDEHDRVVLTPFHVGENMEISWNHASASYLKGYGLSVANLIGNITPKNIQLVADALGEDMDASIYPQVRAQIMSLADDPVFTRANAINYFAPDQVLYEQQDKKQKVFVIGRLITNSFIGATGTAQQIDPKPLVYELTLVVKNGRPRITGFDSYAGNQPHTVKWLATNSKAEKPDANKQQ